MAQPSGLSDEDRAALQRLAIEYVWRVDQARSDTIYELFTEDGRLNVPSGQAEGRPAILEWGRGRSGRKNQSLHVCSNHRFASTGHNTASGLTYVVVFAVTDVDNPTPTLIVAGTYNDEFRRIDGTWLFTSRVLSVLGQP